MPSVVNIFTQHFCKPLDKEPIILSLFAIFKKLDESVKFLRYQDKSHHITSALYQYVHQ